MWVWVAIGIVVSLAAFLIVAAVVIQRAAPLLRSRITETLSARFKSRVELDSLDVSVLHGLEVSGNRLRIFPPDEMAAAGTNQPLIAIAHFSFHAGLTGLMIEPMHVGQVKVDELQINIPPGEMHAQSSERSTEKPVKHGAKIKILVDEILCVRSRLIVGNSNPGKDPKDFELQRIELHNVGPNQPWRYDAALINAIPRGEIHATGYLRAMADRRPGRLFRDGPLHLRTCRPQYHQGHRRHSLFRGGL